MSRSKEDIKKLINITRNSKGRDLWFTGYCPFCGDSQDATIESSDRMAKMAIRGKVMSHIKYKHPEEFSQEGEIEENAQRSDAANP